MKRYTSHKPGRPARPKAAAAPPQRTVAFYGRASMGKSGSMFATTDGHRYWMRITTIGKMVQYHEVDARGVELRRLRPSTARMRMMRPGTIRVPYPNCYQNLPLPPIEQWMPMGL